MGSYTVKNSCGIKCKKENKPQVIYTISKTDQGATGTTGAQGATGLTDQEIKKKIIEARKNAADSDRKMREALKQHQSQQANSYKKERDAYNAEAKRLEELLGGKKNSKGNAQSTSNTQGASGSAQHTSSGSQFSNKKNEVATVKKLMISIGKKYNPLSIKEKREYGGYIYRKNNELLRSKVFKGGVRGLEINFVEAQKLGRDVIADWHTHGGPSVAGNVFSATDMTTSNALPSIFSNYIGSYLFTPNNHMRYYKSNTIPSPLLESYVKIQDYVEGAKTIAKDFKDIGVDYGEI